MKCRFFIFFLLFFITACAGGIPKTPEGWEKKSIETQYLTFAVWEKITQPEGPLRIYIEGDGTPDPKSPVAFELAQRDTTPNVIYVARPCQYLLCDECDNPALWKEERFNEEIVNEMKDLIVYLSHKYKTPSLDLIGYDGGGTMAMLLATKIPLARVVTIGSVLNTQEYVAEKNISPINGMNPADNMGKLARIPQVHYVGKKDTVIPMKYTKRFVHNLKNPKSAVIKVVPNATHTDWGNLIIE